MICSHGLDVCQNVRPGSETHHGVTPQSMICFNPGVRRHGSRLLQLPLIWGLTSSLPEFSLLHPQRTTSFPILLRSICKAVVMNLIYHRRPLASPFAGPHETANWLILARHGMVWSLSAAGFSPPPRRGPCACLYSGELATRVVL